MSEAKGKLVAVCLICCSLAGCRGRRGGDLIRHAHAGSRPAEQENRPRHSAALEATQADLIPTIRGHDRVDFVSGYGVLRSPLSLKCFLARENQTQILVDDALPIYFGRLDGLVRAVRNGRLHHSTR